MSTPTSTTTIIETETLRALYDLAVGSMSYGSGFLDHEDIEIVASAARILGVERDIPEPGGLIGEWRRTEPHLWHQDCELKWLCGRSAGDPIHQIELPK